MDNEATIVRVCPHCGALNVVQRKLVDIVPDLHIQCASCGETFRYRRRYVS